MSHSFSCSMEISRMHQKFENWNDMRHEPRKFWLAETIFFNLCKIIPLATGNHRHPFSVFFFLRKGAAVHGLFQAHEFFLITPISFILSKVNVLKQHFRWSQLRNRKNKKNYPNFSISKVQRNHRGTQRQFSEISVRKTIWDLELSEHLLQNFLLACSS